MREYRDNPNVGIDAQSVQILAAANGLVLTSECAAALVPAVQALFDADAQLKTLDLAKYSTGGMPWEGWQAEDSA